MSISAKTKKRGTLGSVVLFVVLVWVFEGLSPKDQTQPPLPSTSEGIPVMLLKVIDGDTLDVVNERGERMRVRLQGVDALETFHEEKLRRQATYWRLSEAEVKKVGLETKRALDRACRGGELMLYVHAADPVDRYGRTLGYIHCDGRDVVEPLLKAGLLETRREPHERSKRYESLMNHAKSYKKGLFRSL